uniref:Uncharacterized protein n=1 Tax=Aegilops tauschii TaxID=37682 RepID=M8BBZ5_AEGTA
MSHLLFLALLRTLMGWVCLQRSSPLQSYKLARQCSGFLLLSVSPTKTLKFGDKEKYLPTQLNYFRIGQRCNVYIHGRRFFNTELIKGPWTQEEDEKIIDLVNKYGLTKWSHCQLPELPAADPRMFPNMFNLSALGQVTRHALRVYFGGLPPIANEQTVALFFNQVLAAIGGNTFGLGDAVVNMKLIFEFIQNILGGIII